MLLGVLSQTKLKDRTHNTHIIAHYIDLVIMKAQCNSRYVGHLELYGAGVQLEQQEVVGAVQQEEDAVRPRGQEPHLHVHRLQLRAPRLVHIALPIERRCKQTIRTWLLFMVIHVLLNSTNLDIHTFVFFCFDNKILDLLFIFMRNVLINFVKAILHLLALKHKENMQLINAYFAFLDKCLLLL